MGVDVLHSSLVLANIVKLDSCIAELTVGRFCTVLEFGVTQRQHDTSTHAGECEVDAFEAVVCVDELLEFGGVAGEEDTGVVMDVNIACIHRSDFGLMWSHDAARISHNARRGNRRLNIDNLEISNSINFLTYSCKPLDHLTIH